MSVWREHLENNEWHLIDWPDLPETELRELYRQLCKVVPKVWREDGLERIQEHALPRDLDKGPLQFAALMLNEIRGQFEDEPDWVEVAESYARHVLHELGRPIEPESGTSRKSEEAQYLSREWHALCVLELTRHSKVIRAWGSAPTDHETPLTKAESASWMDEMGAIAFTAGRHMQQAWLKPFEKHAMRDIFEVENARKASHEKARKNEPQRNAVRAEMERLRSEGHSIARAADLAASNGFGKTAAANRATWYRYRDSAK